MALIFVLLVAGWVVAAVALLYVWRLRLRLQSDVEGRVAVMLATVHEAGVAEGERNVTRCLHERDTMSIAETMAQYQGEDAARSFGRKDLILPNDPVDMADTNRSVASQMFE